MTHQSKSQSSCFDTDLLDELLHENVCRHGSLARSWRAIMCSNRLVWQATLVAFKDWCQVLFTFGKCNITCCSARSALATGDGSLNFFDKVKQHARTCEPPSACFPSGRWQSIWQWQTRSSCKGRWNLKTRAGRNWWPDLEECWIKNSLSQDSSQETITTLVLWKNSLRQDSSQETITTIVLCHQKTRKCLNQLNVRSNKWMMEENSVVGLRRTHYLPHCKNSASVSPAYVKFMPMHAWSASMACARKYLGRPHSFIWHRKQCRLPWFIIWIEPNIPG